MLDILLWKSWTRSVAVLRDIDILKVECKYILAFKLGMLSHKNKNVMFKDK